MDGPWIIDATSKMLKMKFDGWEVQQVNTRKQSEGKRECYKA